MTTPRKIREFSIRVFGRDVALSCERDTKDDLFQLRAAGEGTLFAPLYTGKLPCTGHSLHLSAPEDVPPDENSEDVYGNWNVAIVCGESVVILGYDDRPLVALEQAETALDLLRGALTEERRLQDIYFEELTRERARIELRDARGE